MGLTMTASSSTLAWKKSRRCDSNACIEVAADSREVLLRDSKHLDGPILRATSGEWASFINGIRTGSFQDK
jgi:predicted secreted Zn-dependent protease